MAQLACGAAWQIDQGASRREQRLRGGANGIFDVIYETDQARLFAIAGGFFDVAAALAFPALGGDNLDMSLAVFEILLCERLDGLE